MIPSRFAGAKYPSYELVAQTRNEDGVLEALDISGATITGRLLNQATHVAAAIAGTLTVSSGSAGLFTWALHANDVVAGSYLVQFKFDYGSSGYALSDLLQWEVLTAV